MCPLLKKASPPLLGVEPKSTVDNEVKFEPKMLTCVPPASGPSSVEMEVTAGVS
jgi:hypothetical protein